MTMITSAMLADMHARRLNGETVAAIAARYNIKPMTCYQRLRREFGLGHYPKPKIAAANDNNPHVATQMVASNGGCSTWSGVLPVSVKRIPTLDTAEVAPSGRELLIAGLADLQVAA
ncbi:hypothetical protein [Rhizobium leguminosarum]|uniref:hypothetical protein n=1 Tax=Rhizobium leguminosarum TaxID=384 RepID=UPI0015DAEFD9|nr:hypothetical protein [Rhizobium leguminosarum]NZD50500.1 hypothetical protein [Rhizobium leguminosarum]